MNRFPMTRTNLVKTGVLGCCLAAAAMFSAPRVGSLSPEAAKAVMGGTCIAPSASCKLNDVCVPMGGPGGITVYYVYWDFSQGFDPDNNSGFYCRTVGMAGTCPLAYAAALAGQNPYWTCT